MSPAAISDETKVLLSRISTATLTSQLLARGLRNTFMQNVYRLTTGGGSMVGEAFTLRYIPSREDLECLDGLRKIASIHSARRWKPFRRATCW